MQLNWSELPELLATLRRRLIEAPVTVRTHEDGIALAERYLLSIYDAMIVAAPLKAGCAMVWSDDVQHGLEINGRMRIVNPFLMGEAPG